jgi:hypothetical protein
MRKSSPACRDVLIARGDDAGRDGEGGFQIQYSKFNIQNKITRIKILGRKSAGLAEAGPRLPQPEGDTRKREMLEFGFWNAEWAPGDSRRVSDRLIGPSTREARSAHERTSLKGVRIDPAL